VDLITYFKNAWLGRNKTRVGRKSAFLVGLSLVLCIALADLPILRCNASAENSGKVVLEFDTVSDKTNTYQVLISETVYSDGQRMTNLYREDFKVQEKAAENGKALRTVVCVGSVTPVGGAIKKLEPSGYYLTVDKTGRILEVKGLKPWDGRRMETIWLAQALLPENPVEPGDTWTVNDVFFSRTTGGKTQEKRAYRFLGRESWGQVTAYKIGYEIVGKGQDDRQDYTYVSTGAFYLASGNLMKLDASEMVTYGGSSEDSKIITMIQVSAVK
jgi:hypothetical protein